MPTPDILKSLPNPGVVLRVIAPKKNDSAFSDLERWQAIQGIVSDRFCEGKVLSANGSEQISDLFGSMSHDVIGGTEIKSYAELGVVANFAIKKLEQG